jgi:hypothetical protein
MNPTDFAQLKGKVARNVYAIIKFELMEAVTILSKSQEKEMVEYMYEAIQNVNKLMKKSMKDSGLKPIDREPKKRGRRNEKG